MDENYNKNTIFVIQIHVLLLILFKLYTNLPIQRAHMLTQLRQFQHAGQLPNYCEKMILLWRLCYACLFVSSNAQEIFIVCHKQLVIW